MSEDPPHTEKQPVPGPQFLEVAAVDSRSITDGFGSETGDRQPSPPPRNGSCVGRIAFISAATLIGVLIVGAVGRQTGLDLWLGAGASVQSLDTTFVDGMRFPMSLLCSIYETGVNQPLFFGLAMLILIPAVAGLAAARPMRPGDVARSASIRVVGLLTLGILIAADVIIGVVLLSRNHPDLEASLSTESWLADLQAMAASDGIATVLAILLAVLAFRLPLDRWACALGGTIAITTAIASLCVSAASTSIVDGVTRDRPMVRPVGSEATSIVLGRLATGGTLHLDLAPPHDLRISRDEDDVLEVVGRESIVGVWSDRN